MTLKKFKRYEYPIIRGTSTYKGSYTLYADVKPLGYPGEKLVDEFEALVKDEK